MSEQDMQEFLSQRPHGTLVDFKLEIMESYAKQLEAVDVTKLPSTSTAPADLSTTFACFADCVIDTRACLTSIERFVDQPWLVSANDVAPDPYTFNAALATMDALCEDLETPDVDADHRPTVKRYVEPATVLCRAEMKRLTRRAIKAKCLLHGMDYEGCVAAFANINLYNDVTTDKKAFIERKKFVRLVGISPMPTEESMLSVTNYRKWAIDTFGPHGENHM
jgi:hypothetical protein